MSRITIQGGIPLRGEYTASGNKNAAMPIIIASLLADGKSQIKNIPNTIDILRTIEQVEQLGCEISFKNNSLEIGLLKLNKIRFGKPILLPAQINLMIAASLLKHAQRITIDGLELGKENVNTHVQVLREFGISLLQGADSLELSRPSSLQGKDLLLDEASVTATELAILVAVMAEGVSRIYNAACEPHVQDLAAYLTIAGAKISGAGTNLILVEGSPTLQGCSFEISEDHIEIGSLIGMVAMTRGDAFIRCARKDRLLPILKQYQKLGITVSENRDGYGVEANDQFKTDNRFIDSQSIISSSPWPNFPSDLISMSVVLATQVHGSTLIHEKLYSTRMHFVDNLIYMGARIVQCDPHRVIVTGPTQLQPIVWETPDVRTGLASLGAGVICTGKMVIEDVQIINRIFENIISKLQNLGAQIGVG